MRLDLVIPAHAGLQNYQNCKPFVLLLSKIMLDTLQKSTKVSLKSFWSIKNSSEVLNNLKSQGFYASGLYIFDFSTAYITLLHNRIID